MRNAKTQQRAQSLRKRTTDTERFLWNHLRRRQLHGFRFRRQVPIGAFIADFVCLEARLIIELDGSQHAQNLAYDDQREGYLQAQGFKILRFWDNQALTENHAVLEIILSALLTASAHGAVPVAADDVI
jgi:very-short-patch-repair endonuclease